MAISDVNVNPMSVIWDGADLGSSSGGVSISVSVDSVDVVSDQNGSAPADSYQTGTAVEISMTLIELNQDNLSYMLGAGVGAKHGGNNRSGLGSSRDFTSMLSRAKTLQLREVGAADNSSDWIFWKAFPVVDSFDLTADSPQSMSVTFRCFKDTTKDASISYGVLKADPDDTWT